MFSRVCLCLPSFDIHDVFFCGTFSKTVVRGCVCSSETCAMCVCALSFFLLESRGHLFPSLSCWEARLSPTRFMFLLCHFSLGMLSLPTVRVKCKSW